MPTKVRKLLMTRTIGSTSSPTSWHTIGSETLLLLKAGQTLPLMNPLPTIANTFGSLTNMVKMSLTTTYATIPNSTTSALMISRRTWCVLTILLPMICSIWSPITKEELSYICFATTLVMRRFFRLLLTISKHTHTAMEKPISYAFPLRR